MIKYGTLTRTPSGYGLPIREEWDLPHWFTDHNDIKHAEDVFTRWTPKELWDIGGTVIEVQDLPLGAVILAYQDVERPFKVTRTFEYAVEEPEVAPVSEAYQLKQLLGGEDILMQSIEAMLLWFIALEEKRNELTAAIQNIRIGGPSNEIQPGPAQSLVEAMDPLLRLTPDLKRVLKKYKDSK